MTRRLTALIACLAGLGVAVPAAEGAVRYGIADQDPAMFSNKLFKDLRVKQSRLIVSYDAVLENTFEVADIDRWLAAAKANRIEPLITFNAPRGNEFGTTSELPSVSTYKKAVRAFMTRYRSYRLKVYSPWNEVNHFSQPTYKNPKRAAQFTKAFYDLCKKCKIVAADILDQRGADKYTKKMMREFDRLKYKPKIWGLHNYSDTNRFRDKGTKLFLKTTKKGEVWLTETGGVFSFGSFKPDEARAAKATRYMAKLAKSDKRIKRLYVYSFFGEELGARFDAGYVNPDGTPRKQYATLKKLTAK